MLPAIESEDQLTALKKDPAASQTLLEEVAARIGLDRSQVETFSEGSAIVGAVGDQVLKVFAPFDGEYAATEAKVLSFLTDRLPIPTPSFLGAETIDGWHLVSMGRLSGVPLATVWDKIDSPSRLQLAREIGRGIAALHALDPTPVDGIPPAWGPFIEKQREGVVERQRKLGLDASWLAQLEPFLAAVDPGESASWGRRSLLHTEVMRDHVLVEREAGGDDWRLSGLIDFEPAMIGPPEYELASVGLFVSGGDRALFAAFLDGLGIPSEQRGPAFARRLLAAALLHRYAHLPWYLDHLAPVRATTLDELALEWWGVE